MNVAILKNGKLWIKLKHSCYLSRMLKKVLLGLGLVIVGILLYVAVSPAEFTITRKAHYRWPPTEVFPHFNSPRMMDRWNPFLKQDPNAKITYSGPEEGVGASSTWESEKVGEGTVTIIESRPPEYVKVKLEFRKPMQGTNFAEYKIINDRETSDIVWSMSGRNNFFQRLVGIFINTDKIVGREFENGLNYLDEILSKGR